jgi:hypothetical protein
MISLWGMIRIDLVFTFLLGLGGVGLVQGLERRRRKRVANGMRHRWRCLPGCPSQRNYAFLCNLETM